MQLDRAVPVYLDGEWGRCFASFLVHMYDHGRSRHTLQSYGATLSRFFSSSAHDGPPKAPRLYTREDVEWFITRATPAPATRNHRLSIISSFYHFAAEYQIERDGELVPLWSGVPPTAGIKRLRRLPVYRAMSYSELLAFFAVIPSNTVQGLRDRALFLVYFWTARRRAEIARLVYGDIEHGTIVGEGGKSYEGWLYHFVGKGTAGQYDTAELPQPAKDAIDAYLEASGRLPLSASAPLWLPVPPQINQGRPLAVQTIYKLFKRYCRLAGLSPRFSPHSLRYTAAQLRYTAGDTPRQLQHLLRHQSIATTYRYLDSAMGAADPGAHKLMADPRFAGFGRGDALMNQRSTDSE